MRDAVSLLIAAGLTLLMSAPAPAAQSGASSGPARQRSSIASADRPPVFLDQIGDSAKQLFDAALAGDWDAAAELVESIQESASELTGTWSKQDLIAAFRSRIRALGTHVRMHERIGAMEDANTISRLATELSTGYASIIPPDVRLLGYYARQLELGVAVGRVAMLTRAATDLKSAWSRVEPMLERRNDINDARRFTDIIAQLDGAHRRADYVGPARAAAAEAEWLEKTLRASRAS